MTDVQAHDGDAKRDPATGEVYLNRSELVQAMGVSDRTIDRSVGDGCPCVERGSRGVASKFLLSQVKQWRLSELARERDLLDERQAAVRQEELKLVGGRPGDNPMALAPKQRRELWKEELADQMAAVQRGQFVPKQKVEADNTQTFRLLAAGLRALPDRLGRECGLNTATIAAIQRAVDGWREQLARYLASHAKLWERTSAA